MPNPIDPDLLATYLAVLEHGRISAAARAVHLSQPAVTARIRKLEKSLGTALLNRSVRGVAPTPAGQRLAGYARDIQQLLDEAMADVGATQALGRLAIVASTTIAAHVLPPVLAAYRALNPEVDIKIQIGNTEEVVEAVRGGKFALGLVEGHRRASGVHLEPWVDDDLQPLVGRATTGWRLRKPTDLADVPILWREPGSGTRAVLVRALRTAGVRSKPRVGDLVLGSSEAIMSGVAAGLGVGFLSRWSLGPHLASGRVRAVPALGLVIRRTFHWAMPSGGLAGTAAHFHQFATRQPPAPA